MIENDEKMNNLNNSEMMEKMMKVTNIYKHEK